MAPAADRVRDHLANERTFLAWLRTGVAMVVFGFAIGRFAIAIRQFMQTQGRVLPMGGFLSGSAPSRYLPECF